MRRFGTLFFCITLLTACQASVAGPQTVDLPALDLRLTYPVAPVVREQGGEYLLRSQGTNVFAKAFPYHQTSRAVDDWTVTPAIRDMLLKNPSCDVLKDRRVYLPVNLRKTSYCNVLSSDPSSIVVAAVGYGIPDAALDFLQSMIVVLRPGDFVVMTGVTPFHQTDAAVQKMSDDFPASHPELPVPLWPNRGFHFLAIDVRDYLQKQLDPPSSEVAANEAALLSIAGSISVTDGEE